SSSRGRPLCLRPFPTRRSSDLAGPGGFYDDLGNPARQPHLVQGLSFAADPGRMRSPRPGFEEDLVLDEPDEAAGVARRISWMDQDRKSTRLNSSHEWISYAVFC